MAVRVKEFRDHICAITDERYDFALVKNHGDRLKYHHLMGKYNMPHKNNCLELTIFSGQRQRDTTIGRAQYRIDNGPFFAGKIAVKS